MRVCPERNYPKQKYKLTRDGITQNRNMRVCPERNYPKQKYKLTRDGITQNRTINLPV